MHWHAKATWIGMKPEKEATLQEQAQHLLHHHIIHP